MNPPTTKPTDTRYLVLRVGSWSSFGPSWVRAAYSGRSVPEDRDADIGFRCALRARQPRV